MTSIFDPLRVGPLALPNRIIMAPMTRSRADANGVPQDMVADYYAQTDRLIQVDGSRDIAVVDLEVRGILA